MANEIFNQEFNEIIPDGATGNQAYFGIFYRNRFGLLKRLTQAEGHEVANNPETEEQNTIGMTSPRTVVRRFHEQFSKDVIIEKGDDNYEFFREFNDKKYSGRNAEVQIVMADFTRNISNASGRQNYWAYAFTATVTPDTANYTDARLAVSFNQSGERTFGIISSENFDDTNKFPEFVASTKILVETMTLSATTASLAPGEEKWVAVGFAPLGCPDGFTATSSDPNVCTAEIRRSSVVVTAVGVGTADITVTSTADSAKSASIAVTVAAAVSGAGGVAPLGASVKTMPAKPESKPMTESKLD